MFYIWINNHKNLIRHAWSLLPATDRIIYSFFKWSDCESVNENRCSNELVPDNCVINHNMIINSKIKNNTNICSVLMRQLMDLMLKNVQRAAIVYISFLNGENSFVLTCEIRYNPNRSLHWFPCSSLDGFICFRTSSSCVDAISVKNNKNKII